MKIRLKTDARLDATLRHMAQEADTTVEKLAQIAVYNIVAMWVAQAGEVEVAGGLDAAQILAIPAALDGDGA